MTPAVLSLLVGSSTKTHHIGVGVITVVLYLASRQEKPEESLSHVQLLCTLQSLSNQT